MIVINFYFSNEEKWIEYSLNGQVEKKYFNTAEELRAFIRTNNLKLTYQGCFTC
jgi:hypothetical protein